MADEQGRVTIISIGCWAYQYLRRLKGPAQDIESLRNVLIADESLALFSPDRYIELLNPTSEAMRQVINDYVHSRTAENDILLLYFSGHGMPVGANDFAFCTVDAKPLDGGGFVLPMTTVKFTDVLSTLWLKKITPIIIIDSCYSGAVGGSLKVAIDQLVDDLKEEVQKKYAGSYAFLCSAPLDKEVKDNPDGQGGFFSHAILQIAEDGIEGADKRSPTIYLDQIHPPITRLAEQSGYDPYPMFFLGPTLPKLPIFKNTYYEALEYRLQPHLVAVLRVLWNNGDTQTLRPGQIADTTGIKGAYGNHNKLSFLPWNLVETVDGRKRRLTERGIEFMRGNLAVPQDIVLDPNLNDYVSKSGTAMITIRDFVE